LLGGLAVPLVAGLQFEVGLDRRGGQVVPAVEKDLLVGSLD